MSTLEWKRCRKKPVVVEFREVKGLSEMVETHEGKLMAFHSTDFIIRGIKGELYPIKKDIFRETYDVLADVMCGALSPRFRLPCTEPIGHEGNHKNKDENFVWANDSGIILGEEEDRKLKGEMSE